MTGKTSLAQKCMHGGVRVCERGTKNPSPSRRQSQDTRVLLSRQRWGVLMNYVEERHTVAHWACGTRLFALGDSESTGYAGSTWSTRWLRT